MFTESSSFSTQIVSTGKYHFRFKEVWGGDAFYIIWVISGTFVQN